MKKDFVIQITRIVAMFMIIICHLVQEFDNRYIQMTSQFFNVGVFIFILISGYLYGTKKIENPKEWLKNRFFKIMIPVYVFMIFIFGWEILVQHHFKIKYVLIYLFDLQFVWRCTRSSTFMVLDSDYDLLYDNTNIVSKERKVIET